MLGFDLGDFLFFQRDKKLLHYQPKFFCRVLRHFGFCSACGFYISLVIVAVKAIVTHGGNNRIHIVRFTLFIRKENKSANHKLVK